MPVSVSRPLALLALAAAIALPLPPAAHAAAPAAPTQQVPGVYRKAIGRLRVPRCSTARCRCRARSCPIWMATRSRACSTIAEEQPRRA